MFMINIFKRIEAPYDEQEYERDVKVPTQLEGENAQYEIDCIQDWVAFRKNEN